MENRRRASGASLLGILFCLAGALAPEVGFGAEIELLSGKRVRGEIVKETQDFIDVKSAEGKTFRIKREKVREIRERGAREENEEGSEGQESGMGNPPAERKDARVRPKAVRNQDRRNYVSLLAPAMDAGGFALMNGVGSGALYLRRGDNKRWWGLLGAGGGTFDIEGFRGFLGALLLGGRYYARWGKAKPPAGWFSDLAVEVGGYGVDEKGSGDSDSGVLFGVLPGVGYSWVWKSGFSVQLNLRIVLRIAPSPQVGTSGSPPWPVNPGGLVDLGWAW